MTDTYYSFSELGHALRLNHHDRIRAKFAGGFDESKHDRDDSGKFAPKGEGGKGGGKDEDGGDGERITSLEGLDDGLLAEAAESSADMWGDLSGEERAALIKEHEGVDVSIDEAEAWTIHDAPESVQEAMMIDAANDLRDLEGDTPDLGDVPSKTGPGPQEPGGDDYFTKLEKLGVDPDEADNLGREVWNEANAAERLDMMGGEDYVRELLDNEDIESPDEVEYMLNEDDWEDLPDNIREEIALSQAEGLAELRDEEERDLGPPSKGWFPDTEDDDEMLDVANEINDTLQDEGLSDDDLISASERAEELVMDGSSVEDAIVTALQEVAGGNDDDDDDDEDED